ncbi:MAG: hypothetical protein IJ887_10680 [Prevotella sp.]|nr:hypothetical protein [Prevotella sp.]
MAYEALIERIKKLSEPTIEQMSPEVMARLTHFFEEPLVRQLLYTVTTNFEQRKVIQSIMKAYQSWKKNTNASYIPAGLMPRVFEYPEYMNDLQMDIECGMVITEKGTFSENTTRLKISLIPQGAVPIKAIPKESQQVLDKKDEEKSAANNQNASYIENLNKQLAELKQENEDLKKKVAELQQPVENLTAKQKVRMELALQLLKAAGATDEVLEQQSNKQKAATIMSVLLDIRNNNSRGNEAQTCATYISARDLSPTRHQETIDKLNLLLKELNINIQL